MTGKYLLGAIALLFIFQSCNKPAQNLTYTISIQTQPAVFSIPSSTDSTDVLPYGAVYMAYNLDSAVKAQTAHQLGISNIKSVKLVSCVLTLHNPTLADNFHSFSSLSAGIASDAMSTPYYVTNNSIKDTFAYILNMPVDTSAQLGAYFASDQFRYSLTGRQSKSTKITLICSAVFTFTAEADN